MATVLRMPAVAANAEHARLETWLVDEGAPVTEGQVVAEIETEKAMVELIAESDGTLHRHLVPAGADVKVGTPIGIVAPADASEAELAAILESVETDAAESASPVVDVPAPRDAPPEPATRQFSSPLARKRAREFGIEITTIDGSGPNGRVTVRDVAARGAVTAPAAAIQPPNAEAGYVDVPHTAMRRAIARRLTESKSTVPHYYLSAQCRADALLALRQQINSGPGARKVSVTDLIVLAAALAFVEVPEANVIWTTDALRRFTTVDIALAVAIEGGLLTPVIRDVASQRLVDLSAAIEDVVARARDGRVSQRELEGGSFAITNLGMYGTDSFAAILNPPQSGILAIGEARKVALVDGDEVVAGTVIDVTLSVDHRAIDGALGATWLAAFRRIVENPLSLLLRAG